MDCWSSKVESCGTVEPKPFQVLVSVRLVVSEAMPVKVFTIAVTLPTVL